jgi:hypothetical protein
MGSLFPCRPLSAVSGASLGSVGPTPRVNPYLQDMRPTTPLQSLGRGAEQNQSITAAVSGAFRAPSPLVLDPATGQVVVARRSRPASAGSDDTDFSQTSRGQHRKLMNPMAVRLTPLGAVLRSRHAPLPLSPARACPHGSVHERGLRVITIGASE